jgi:Raf kinase inhibitor-like YbhB/YbcL family protein
MQVPGRVAVVVTLGVVLGFGLAACGSKSSGSDAANKLATQRVKNSSMQVSSAAFANGARIPQMYTCDGKGVSPPIAWDGVPDDAKSLALVVDDPDAPGGTYVHWVVFDIDRAVTGVGEGSVPKGARQAKNSAGDAAYTGPCPPKGDDIHHYRFTVYALGAPIGAKNGAAAKDVLDDIRTSAIAKGMVTGTYNR